MTTQTENTAVVFDPEREIRLSQLAFTGKIIANFTHEIKNHFAIVKETAGLVSDLISMGKLSKSDAKQYLQFLSSIDDQIGKSLALISCLNRFSHRPDSEISVFSVNEVVVELIALTARLADQKRIALRSELDFNAVPVSGNPSLLHLLLFSLLNRKLNAFGRNTVITFSTLTKDHKTMITMTTEGERVADENRDILSSPELMESVLARIGADLTEDPLTGSFRISFASSPQQ